LAMATSVLAMSVLAMSVLGEGGGEGYQEKER